MLRQVATQFRKSIKDVGSLLDAHDERVSIGTLLRLCQSSTPSDIGMLKLYYISMFVYTFIISIIHYFFLCIII